MNSEVSHFEYPVAFGKVFEQVHEQFKKHKHIMSLKHHNNLGSVELELAFKNGQHDKFRCEPVQAAIISLFDKVNNPQQASLSVDFIAERLQAHANYIKAKIFYWIKRGVLQELSKKTSMSQSQTVMTTMASRAFGRSDTNIEEDAVYELVQNY